jgi:branched-chain amino acid transport system permease protein
MITQLHDLLYAYQDLFYGLGVNAILALSLYAVVALGQLSLGQAAFMGIGAYVGAVFSVKLGLPFEAALLAAMIAPAFVAAIVGIPTLRLTGVYLAIATIGLGEVLRIIYLNSPYLGGALGLSGIPNRANGWIIYGLLAVILLAFQLIMRSRIGRAVEAIREDEDAAAVMGINVAGDKMAALILSAALAGLGGALNAHYSSFISPGEFGFENAVAILSYVVLGGVATPFGPVVGAFLLTALPEILRSLHELRGVFNGLIIVLVMILLPKGLLGWRVRRTG